MPAVLKWMTVVIVVVSIGLVVNTHDHSLSDDQIKQQYTNSHSRFMDVDGNRVHFRDEGAGDVIVLIHGTASSLHAWDDWTELLKHQYRVIRVDLPGFGLTGPDRVHRYEVKDDVAFFSAFLSQLDIETFHIAGSSLGGRIAWQLALDNPERVMSLTLLNALGYPQTRWPPAIEIAQWPFIGETFSTHVPKFAYQFSLKEVYADDGIVDETLVNRYYDLAQYADNSSAFSQRVSARLDTDSHLIRGIKTPTLIMWGAEDVYFPVANAHLFKRDIEDSRLLIYEQIGHLPMEELPAKTAQDFMFFIASIHDKTGSYNGVGD